MSSRLTTLCEYPFEQDDLYIVIILVSGYVLVVYFPVK